ncbi:D-2-hydroxyacid dehydrogenase [Enterococcus hulanensis]|uniref:D-2-hydroxyacid dehydrogenase n=1 Tax=Enterococcus hulanensis TaxID=2559929 RepID=A0ABU3ETG5_9ENTE|nr:D-2-hydroxyacid dehydrogenase [Enterococcus hulanensis]MDT2598148.1 D-2-hydroxyacid dehydrogenase [Enterococcus hulanensis]MDT2608347.1 D-2-hydroxyacid dehydrogenase [Enterococcus hulanensis]MDT2615642.1 D-2-hydroxyacid dehydrogenase [Enterococcus hulanensis]MDT2626387.1 D-2-hydroxyacid dehydrogenase [Enterococcus hulanensis]MDT2654714.1 D-2-hydroxyacid dehydrogenase [Enterococcus hulanensis]
MKIVVLDGYTENPGDLSWDALGRLGELTVYDRTPQDQVIERIGNAEIVLVNKVQMTKEIIEQAAGVKYIGVLATGYNVVDVDAAKAKGITVTNIPTYGTDGVAQYAIALLLELCHRIGDHSNTVSAGDWTNNADWCYWNSPQMELAGKTLGIIGYGRIGQKVGAIASALGMNVLANDRGKKQDTSAGAKLVDLDQLFKESDVISLHCPLFPETEGIINKENIAKMKDGVYIINDSRGQLINEADLRDALNSGKVGGAAVDVVSTEPIKMDNPLLEAKNMIITPHMAWASREARSRLMDIAVENVEKFQQGTPVNVVN